MIADYIAVATQVKRNDVFRDVFDHPLVKSGYDARGSIQIPDVKAIRRKAAKLFPPTGTRPTEARFDPAAGPGRRADAQPVEVVDLRHRRRTPKPDAQADPQADPEADAQAHQAAEADARADAGAAALERGRVAAQPLTMDRSRSPTPRLVVLVGAAGSGKSTFAARHFAPDEVLSSDAFRALIAGDPADQSATRAAFSALHRALARRLAQGRLTVVDATSVQRARACRPAPVGRRGARPGRGDRAGPPARRRPRAEPRTAPGGVVPAEAVDRQLADLASALRPGGIDAEGFARDPRAHDAGRRRCGGRASGPGATRTCLTAPTGCEAPGR